MNTIWFSLIGLGLVLGGLLFLLISLYSMQTSDVSRRLQDFVVEDTGLQQRLALEEEMRKAELRGSFGSRVISPFFKSMSRILGRMTPATVLKDYDR